jgi:hypothetical protein
VRRSCPSRFRILSDLPVARILPGFQQEKSLTLSLCLGLTYARATSIHCCQIETNSGLSSKQWLHSFLNHVRKFDSCRGHWVCRVLRVVWQQMWQHPEKRALGFAAG